VLTYLSGHLESGNTTCQPRLQLTCIQGLAVFYDDRKTDVLTIHLVLDGETHNFGHSWVLRDDIIELNRTNLLTTLVDQFLDSATGYQGTKSVDVSHAVRTWTLLT